MNSNHNPSQVLDQHEDLPELPNLSSSLTDERENGTGTQPIDVSGSSLEAVARPKSATTNFLERGNNAKYGALIRNLYEMINTTDDDTTIWLDYGGFSIKDKQKFEQKLREREVSKSFSSFQRMLANYQFKRSTQVDGSINYYHEFFKKDQIELLDKIKDKRSNVQEKRPTKDQKKEIEQFQSEIEELRTQNKTLVEENKLHEERMKLLMAKLNRAESLVIRYEEELRRRISAEGTSIRVSSNPSDVLESAESLLILHGGQGNQAENTSKSVRSSKRTKVSSS
jgi:hypothetical protein